MRVWALVSLLLGAAAAARGEVTVQLGRDGRLDVRATTAPLPEVLDRLARQTGMKVMYDGPPPRPLLTLTLERRTPVEAVLGILEGLGLNYAVVMDPTATRVELLVMAGAAAPAAAPLLPAAPPRPTLPSPLRPRGLGPLPNPADAQETDEPAEEEPGPAPGQNPVPSPPPGFTTPPVLPSPLPQMPAAPAGPGPSAVTPPNYPTSPFAPRILPPMLMPGVNPPPGTTPTPEATPPP